MRIVSIIPARGGSKGIPSKNTIPICGKPLIYWTINQSINSELINDTFVSSDSDEILSLSESFGTKTIKRPDEFATDTATSESVLIHAINEIEKSGKIDLVVFLQPTSPIRDDFDIDNAIKTFIDNDYDSLFSACEMDDFLTWKKTGNNLESDNYDYKNRKRRQEHDESQYLENGSIYIFKPEILKTFNNRLGGKMGVYIMDKYKMFEIDTKEDIAVCEKFL